MSNRPWDMRKFLVTVHGSKRRADGTFYKEVSQRVIEAPGHFDAAVIAIGYPMPGRLEEPGLYRFESSEDGRLAFVKEFDRLY